jgi:hypothetical protein
LCATKTNSEARARKSDRPKGWLSKIERVDFAINRMVDRHDIASGDDDDFWVGYMERLCPLRKGFVGLVEMI